MSVDKTLEERGSRYGDFADHARIAQGIQDVMRAAPKWDQLDLDMKQALSVIADKIARILNGDPFYTDNWHDIQGYAKLIEARINMVESEDDVGPFAPGEVSAFIDDHTTQIINNIFTFDPPVIPDENPDRIDSLMDIIRHGVYNIQTDYKP